MNVLQLMLEMQKLYQGVALWIFANMMAFGALALLVSGWYWAVVVWLFLLWCVALSKSGKFTIELNKILKETK